MLAVPTGPQDLPCLQPDTPLHMSWTRKEIKQLMFLVVCHDSQTDEQCCSLLCIFCAYASPLHVARMRSHARPGNRRCCMLGDALTGEAWPRAQVGRMLERPPARSQHTRTLLQEPGALRTELAAFAAEQGLPHDQARLLGPLTT